MMRLIIGSVGSSPLTRGTHLPGLKQKDKDRFIPAYAGNSDETGAIAPVETVHPRLRGELFFVDEVLPGDTGSSPLTRGTLALRIQGLPTMRFIPAYAGNSQRSNRWNHQSPVHPRLRGELQAIFRLGEISDGSSPLTRGTLILRKCKRS